MFHEGQRGLIEVGARNVPARREARLVQGYRPLGLSDGAVTVADHQVTGRLADIDAVVAIGGVAHDPFVFFIERVHGWPGERNALLQLARVGQQLDVLPRPTRCVLLACTDGVPGGEPKVGVPGGVLVAFQRF